MSVAVLIYFTKNASEKACNRQMTSKHLGKWHLSTSHISLPSMVGNNKCSAVAETGDETGDRLATIDMGQKLGAVPLLWGESGSWLPSHVASAEAYLRTKWHLDPSSSLATTDMGRNLGRGRWVPI